MTTAVEPVSPAKATRLKSNPVEQSFRDLVSLSGAPKVIFTDFFDTLVGRTVEPEYVKELWATRVRHAAGITTEARRIHELRVESEAALCRASVTNGFDDEFRYLDLCREVFTSLRRLGGISEKLSLAEFTHIAESVELKIEREVQFVYPLMLDFLRDRKKEGMPLFVISDSFLSPRQFRSILDHHGLTDLIDNFFLSSDKLLAKRSGRMYGSVLELLNLQPSDALMLGDNLISDIERSGQNGIRSIHVSHDIKAEERRNRATAQGVLKEVLLGDSWCRSPVFPELPLSLAFFIRVLHRRAVQLGFKDLLFCSREGLILKDLFEDYQNHLGLRNRIRTHYYYTSRLASFLPSLSDLKVENFERLFRQYRKLSLRTFLLNLQFSENEIVGIANDVGVEHSRELDDFPSSELFHRLKNLKHFADVYETNRSEQARLSREYIQGFFPGNRLPTQIGLVDIGWKGTIQDNVRALLTEGTHLHGFYLGLVAPGAVSPSNSKEGLLFHFSPSTSPFAKIFSESCALFEILLSALHPGTEKYCKSDGRVEPVFGKIEKPPRLEAQLSNYQESFRTAFSELLRLSACGHLDEDMYLEAVARRHARMVFQPTCEELRLISSQEHSENFGIFNETSFFIPEYIPLGQRLRNTVRYFRNPSSVLHSSLWPALSLSRHGLGWMQPLYTGVNALKVFNEPFIRMRKL
jgi:FMN phosphatase YigB (HAD superfamily)